MINTSSEYNSRIRKNRKFFRKSPLEFADGTILNLVDLDFINDGVRIDDSVGDKIALGTTIINKCTYYLNNFNGKFNKYDFTDVVLRPEIGLQLSETIEYLAKGVFTVDNPGAKGSIIILEALDNMAKFNTEFKDVTISFPCTNSQLLQAVSLYCGVSLATVSFLNEDYIINERPADESISCREVVSWIAQMAGCFARCNTKGALELKWFDFGVFESEANLDGGTFDSATPYATGDNVDGGNFTDYTSGDNVDGGSFTDMDRYHHLYSFSGSPTIGTDDIMITGIQVTDSAETPTTVLYGVSGYILPIEGNELIQDSTQTTRIANTVGAKIVGMKFRQFSGSVQSDPSMEAGDIAFVSDRKWNRYQILFTSLSYTPGNYEPITCGAETPAKNSYRPTNEMKAIIAARKVAKQEVSTYNLAVQQFTNLMTYGFGLYKSEELQPDGSTIYYMHDKPTREESDSIWKFGSNGLLLSTDKGATWGVDTNGNMLVNVLTAIGVNAEWIKVLTSFTVGDNFSVDSGGRLKAFNVVIAGIITATSGKIGPFDIDEFGLGTDIIKLRNVNNFPRLELNKAGDDNGAYEDNTNNSGRGVFDTGFSEISNITDGIRTYIKATARDYATANPTGTIAISKFDINSNYLLSKTEISDDKLSIKKYESFGIVSSETVVSDTGGIKLVKYEGGEESQKIELRDNTFRIRKGDFMFSIVLDEDDGTIYISGTKININGHVF